jgi:hypothetical protein
MNASQLAKPRSKSFRLESVPVPNADGATCERRQSSIAPILNAPKSPGLNANLLAKLSRRKVVRCRQRSSLVGFQGNLLG